MKRKKKSVRIRLMAIGLSFIILLGGCLAPSGEGNKGSEAVRVRLTDTVMGTVADVTIYVKTEDEKGQGEEIAREILREVRDLEEMVLSKKSESSEVWRINHATSDGGGIEISGQLYDVLDKCQKMSEDSEGAFDVRVGKLTELWNMDEIAAGSAARTLPDEEMIGKAVEEMRGGRLLLMDGRLKAESAMLDLGSVGKGVALDGIAVKLDRLREEKGETVAGVFALGGSILTYGDKPDGTPWKIGIVDPASPGETLGTISLSGEYCTSTSGDYERFFELNGRRWHHILDPKTGYPTDNGVHGVTIVSKSGFLSDALSTACFVLGKEKGMALAEKYGAEILMACENGEIVMSDGMKSIFSPSK